MKTIFLFLFSICFAWSSLAQHKISIQVKSAPNTKVQLAYYFADKQYVEARGTTDANGKVIFEGKKNLFPGLYMFLAPEKKIHFDFLIDDQQEFSIKATPAKQSMKAKGSLVNSAFFAYQTYMSTKNVELKTLATLRDSLQKVDENSSEFKKVDADAKALQTNMMNYWNKVVDENKELIIAPLLTALNGEKPYKGVNGGYFFENIDFSKRFLLRSPIVRETIMRVLAFNLNKKRPTSEILTECDKLLKKAEIQPDVFEYTFNYLLNFFNTLQRTGMNEVFVHLVENYSNKGKTPWYKPEHLLQIQERSKVLRSNFIGEVSADLQMMTFENELVSLHDTDAKFTIVYFWSVLCGHCKDTSPHVKKLYDTVGDPSALEVFAICTDDRKADAEKYIIKNEYDSWLNVTDPKNETGYRELYNVYSTPLLYLLDKDKKIIAKRLGPIQIKELIDELLLQKDRFK